MRRFSSYHPWVLFAYFACVLGVAMFLPHPAFLACALLGGTLSCAALEPARRFFGTFRFSAPMFLAVALTNPLVSHGGKTVLFYFADNPVTLESLLYGVNLAAMLVAVLCWFRAFSLVFTSDRLMFLFGGALPKLGLLLSVVFRFVPLFVRRIGRVSDAGRALGLYAQKGFRAKLRGMKRVFLIMLSWSLENAVDTARAMNARGYALRGKTRFSLFCFHARDARLLLAVLSLSALVFVPAALGATRFAFYPSVSGAAPAPAALAAFCAFGALCLLPFLIECKETLKWNYFVSRM